MKVFLLFLALISSVFLESKSQFSFNFFTNTTGDVIGYKDGVGVDKNSVGGGKTRVSTDKTSQTFKQQNSQPNYNIEDHENSENENSKIPNGMNFQNIQNNGTMHFVSGSQTNHYYYAKKLEDSHDKRDVVNEYKETREETTEIIHTNEVEKF